MRNQGVIFQSIKSTDDDDDDGHEDEDDHVDNGEGEHYSYHIYSYICESN